MLAGTAWATDMTDQQVRERIVRESVASYSGHCTSPENTDQFRQRH
jgi:hypothetical protein